MFFLLLQRTEFFLARLRLHLFALQNCITVLDMQVMRVGFVVGLSTVDVFCLFLQSLTIRVKWA